MIRLPESVRCPDCGTEIVSEPGLPGLCPQCLLSLALQQSPATSAQDDGGSDPEALTLDRPTPGRILGERYQIREVLGRGGMGEVFRAFDLKLRVEVALKAVRAEKVESERAREMLRSEVRSAREVLSPNVCRIFDLVAEDGQELVSMEYVDGKTLGQTLRERGPLPLQEAREIASQFLAGLDAIPSPASCTAISSPRMSCSHSPGAWWSWTSGSRRLGPKRAPGRSRALRRTWPRSRRAARRWTRGPTCIRRGWCSRRC
jgi:hypothetical protein